MAAVIFVVLWLMRCILYASTVPLIAGARIKRVECDEGGGQFKAPFKTYRVILDKNGGTASRQLEIALIVTVVFGEMVMDVVITM